MDFIAIPCNSAHVYDDELAASINVSLLNIISETLAWLSGSGRTPLLSTRGTLESGLYQSGFEKAGLAFHFHDDWQPKGNQIIALIKSGDIEKGASSHWRGFLEDLKKTQIEQAAMACTDLNAVLPFSETDIALIDSTQALAKVTVNVDIGGSG